MIFIHYNNRIIREKRCSKRTQQILMIVSTLVSAFENHFLAAVRESISRCVYVSVWVFGQCDARFKLNRRAYICIEASLFCSFTCFAYISFSWWYNSYRNLADGYWGSLPVVGLGIVLLFILCVLSFASLFVSFFPNIHAVFIHMHTHIYICIFSFVKRFTQTPRTSISITLVHNFAQNFSRFVLGSCTFHNSMI